MKVLITGGKGQVGRALIEYIPSKYKIWAPTRSEFNLSDQKKCINYIKELSPDWIINCAAYTSVDEAEKEKDLAFEINANGPRYMAEALLETGGKIIQISSDFVFDGYKNLPYKTNDPTSPLSQYGLSKALGEKNVMNILKDTNQYLILRTSWVMSPYRNNFALTMLKLHQNKESIKVVCDQIGSPTSAHSLASACWEIIKFAGNNNLPSILHWTDSGIASWYDIAVAIGEISQELGLIKIPAQVYPISTKEYKTLATRPSYSVLDTSQTIALLNKKPIHWRKSLFTFLKTLSLNKL